MHIFSIHNDLLINVHSNNIQKLRGIENFITGWLVASLAFFYQISVASPEHDKQKCLQTLPNVSGQGESYTQIHYSLQMDKNSKLKDLDFLLLFFSFFFFFSFGHEACGILVPQPGIKTTSSLKAQNLNHWTAR